MDDFNKKCIAVEVANTALNQIICNIGMSVFYSWGVCGYGTGWMTIESGLDCPCLILDVTGLVHKGRVIIALDEANDWYDVLLLDANGERVGDWRNEIYCDELGRRLDEYIERPADMTDDEYISKADADTFAKTGLHL